MSVDLMQTVIELRDLHQRARQIRQRLDKVTGTTTVDILLTTRALCERLKGLRKRMPEDIQVRSCFPHNLSPEAGELLQNLETQASGEQSGSFIRRSLSRRLSERVTRTGSKVWVQQQIQTDQLKVIGVSATSSHTRLRSTSTGHMRTIHEVLEMLFTAECLVLTEYLETIIPVLYANFIAVMVHLPSAQYHEEMNGVSSENVRDRVQGILLYALLELLSFVVLAMTMRRSCGLHALYHLAFVLEVQASHVQCKFILWSIMMLAYRVVHFGADFSFRFEWMK